MFEDNAGMKYHVWIIVDIKPGGDTYLDPFIKIPKQVEWLTDTLGKPVYGLNLIPTKRTVKNSTVWRLTIHCVEEGKVHYRISFSDLDDATYFKLACL